MLDIFLRTQGSSRRDSPYITGTNFGPLLYDSTVSSRIWSQNHDLYLKPEKCLFEQDTIEFLSLVIGNGCIEIDKAKLSGAVSWLVPTKVKDVQAFLGFANFYCQFI